MAEQLGSGAPDDYAEHFAYIQTDFVSAEGSITRRDYPDGVLGIIDTDGTAITLFPHDAPPHIEPKTKGPQPNQGV